MKSTRHKVEGAADSIPLFWYSVGGLVAVYPFTRSRMNLTTLGRYGKSARTSPIVSTWMWGTCYLNCDGTPSAYDARNMAFGAPLDFHQAHTYKAEALTQAREMAARAKADSGQFSVGVDLQDRDIVHSPEATGAAVEHALKNGAQEVSVRRVQPKGTKATMNTRKEKPADPDHGISYPLTAPTCPHCYKQTIRRRRYWEIWTRVFCKTPGCGAVGELSRYGHDKSWSWMKPTATTINKR